MAKGPWAILGVTKSLAVFRRGSVQGCVSPVGELLDDDREVEPCRGESAVFTQLLRGGSSVGASLGHLM